MTESSDDSDAGPSVDLLDLISKERARADVTHSDALASLNKLIQSSDSIYILGNVGLIFFMCQSDKSLVDEVTQLELHHLELLQAYFLKLGKQQDFVPEAHPVILRNEAISLAKLLATSAAEKRVCLPHGAPDSSQLDSTVEQIRSDTQFVRGAFHEYQSEKYLRAIFRRVDVKFKAIYKLSASEVLDLLLKLVALFEKKLNRYRKLVHRVIRVQRAKDALRAYERAFPSERNRMPYLISLIGNHVKPQHIKHFLMEQSFKFAPEAFCISQDEMMDVCQDSITASNFSKILDTLSFGFGTLDDTSSEHFYLGNPIRTRPFIRLSSGQFFLPSPSTLYASFIEIFEELILNENQISKQYENAKAVVLEEELNGLLREYFPAADVYPNVRWIDPITNQAYQNDALVVIDRTAFIFEAKSGRITPEAKRGADARLRREIEKLMIEPARQSKRFEDFLTQRRQKHRLQSNGEEFELNSAEIQSFVRLNITFDTIGPAFSNWPQLVDAGLASDKEIQISTMGIADLDVVFRVLKDQSTINHYLKKRSDFDRRVRYRADEDDLLVFYLHSGFNSIEGYSGTFVDLYGLSDVLRPFFAKGRLIELQSTPRPQRAGLWTAIVKLLEDTKPNDWLNMTYQLLEFPFALQMSIEFDLQIILKLVRNTKKEENFATRDYAIGADGDKKVVVFCVYQNRGASTKHLIEQCAFTAIKKHRIDRCLVIGHDVFGTNAPYHVIEFISEWK